MAAGNQGHSTIADRAAISFRGGADKRIYIAVGAVWLTMMALQIWLIAMGGPWWPLAACFCVGFGIVASIQRVLLESDGRILRYRTLWRGTRQVAIEHIRSARLGTGWERYRDRYSQPYVYIRVERNDGYPPLWINAKVLSRECVRQVLAIGASVASRSGPDGDS
jgi:hypothetical protein